MSFDMDIPKNVLDYLSETASLIGKIQRDEFAGDTSESLSDVSSSPIEQILYTAFCFLRKTWGCNDYIEDIENNDKWIEEALSIYPQFRVGQYKVDFMVVGTAVGEYHRIIVECDGHEFHDRDENQRRHEKQRDRYLQRKGYKVFHFTGSEIVNNPYKIACEVFAEALGIRPGLLADSFISYLSNEKQIKELNDFCAQFPASYSKGL